MLPIFGCVPHRSILADLFLEEIGLKPMVFEVDLILSDPDDDNLDDDAGESDMENTVTNSTANEENDIRHNSKFINMIFQV